MKRILAWSVTALMLAGLALPGFAAEEKADPAPEWEEKLEDGQEALKDTLSSLLDMLDGVISAIPQYEAPEVLENGDIIIRRKRPEEDQPKKPEQEKDGAIETAL